jgi:hypothetical protein
MLTNGISQYLFETSIIFIQDAGRSHNNRSSCTSNVNRISYRTTEWSLPCPITVTVGIYTVNPRYPRDLKSSTDSATTSFKGVTCVNPSRSSALVVLKSMLNRTSFVKLGSPRGTFGIPSSTATLTYLCNISVRFNTKGRNGS